MVLDVNAADGAIKREYAWHPDGVDRLFAVRIPAPGADTLAAVLDPITGTVRGLARFRTGAIVKEYAELPWGDAVADTGLVLRYRFAGREYDAESGLYSMRARYYDPGIGRWVSEDPIGVGGGANLYGYAGNDPINLVDPSGLEWLLGRCTGSLDDGTARCEWIWNMPELEVVCGLECALPFGEPGMGGGPRGWLPTLPGGANKGEQREDGEAPAIVVSAKKEAWKRCNAVGITYIATIGPPPLQRGVFDMARVSIQSSIKLGPIRMPVGGNVGVYRGTYSGPVGSTAAFMTLPAQGYVHCASGNAVFIATVPSS